MGTVFSPFKYNWVQWNTVCCAQWIISLQNTCKGTAEYLETVGISQSQLLQKIASLDVYNRFLYFFLFFWHGRLLSHWSQPTWRAFRRAWCFFKHIHGSMYYVLVLEIKELKVKRGPTCFFQVNMLWPTLKIGKLILRM